MKEKSKGKGRIIYYLVLAVSVLLLVAATVLTVYFVTDNRNLVLEEEPPIENPDDKDPTEPSGGGATVLVSPIANMRYAAEYSASYTSGLNNWSFAHMALDLIADEGEAVRCIAAGTVEEIYTDSFTGNYIIVDHGGGLKSIYRYVEIASGLKKGDSIAKGQEIATVAAAYGYEKYDGTHLHFEMEINGESVNPLDYFEAVLVEK